ncbi:MAG: class I SAM-dependent methyltransferase [Nitrospinae bacterium]|nr:class I SAM-dependent methyltransferase [Nitrospinota bacterium]MBL7021416.1 class I SAM-dependent methyltransferase [Nitrospinaceae bacterium]
MKIFHDPKHIAVLTALLFLCSVSPVLAKPKDKDRWNNKYETEVYLFGEKPIPFLVDNVHLLPKGKVLDIAMGEGRNGVYLATQGFDVLGLDISEKGLEKAHRLAKKNNVTIETKVVDLENFTLEPNTYDVILCSYYMQKNLFRQFQSALKPGGMIVVETYNIDYLKYVRFSRKWALDTNELLDIFKGLRVIRYQDYDDGKEAYSSIIAQKQ